MKKLLLAIAVVAVTLTGCRKDDNDGVIAGKTKLTGAQAVPANASAGVGDFEYSYNHNTRVFTYKVTYSALTDSATAFVITKANPGAAVGSSVDQLFNFSTPVNLQRRTAASFTGQMVVDGIKISLDDLKTNKFTVLVRTKAFPTGSGEIRGQIGF